MAMFAFGEWWESLATAEQVFWLIGSSGSLLLILQTILSFVGIDADTDMDLDVDAEIDLDLSVFSFKSLVAFFTFFGWMGVIGLTNGWSLPLTLLASVGAGLVAMFMVAYMLFQFQKLESSGTMRFEDALMAEGEVYLAIPESISGEGQVTLELSGQLRELSAVTNGERIATGSRIRVIDILEGNVLLVEPLKELSSGEISNFETQPNT
jgi:membrane protein implicated in regulation of membrane protease activity